MLTTMGQGVVLNALLQAGFTVSSHHFDIARLFKSNERRGANPRVITVEITQEVDFGNRRPLLGSEERPESERRNEFGDLPDDLADLVASLTEQGGCKFIVTPSYWPESLCFERIDHFNLGTPHGGPAASIFQNLSTKVKVRVSIASSAGMPRIY